MTDHFWGFNVSTFAALVTRGVLIHVSEIQCIEMTATIITIFIKWTHTQTVKHKAEGQPQKSPTRNNWRSAAAWKWRAFCPERWRHSSDASGCPAAPTLLREALT